MTTETRKPDRTSKTSLLTTLKRAVYPVSSTMIATATLVEGTLKGGNVPFRTLFVHNSSFNDHLAQRMYEGEPRVLRKWRILIPRLKRMIQQNRLEFDLCVAVLPFFYDRLLGELCDFKAYEEVRQVIDTSGGWEAMRQEFGKKKRQTTNNFSERFGLSYRISKDVKDFDHFYHRMHVPHIRRRYGELSQIDSYEDMKSFFLKGLLLFVTKDDQPIAGALSLIEDKSIVFRRTGVLDGDETVVKGGAQTALYYFQLKYAADNGFRAVDAMKSAPYLNDGVFRHKAEWGACTLPDDEATRWVFFFGRGPNEKLAQFFDTNPIVATNAAGLRGVVGHTQSNVAATTVADDIQRRFHMKGLHDLRIYGPDGPKTVALAPPAAPPVQGGPRAV
jgi:hypothetical protein